MLRREERDKSSLDHPQRWLSSFSVSCKNSVGYSFFEENKSVTFDFYNWLSLLPPFAVFMLNYAIYISFMNWRMFFFKIVSL